MRTVAPAGSGAADRPARRRRSRRNRHALLGRITGDLLTSRGAHRGSRRRPAAARTRQPAGRRVTSRLSFCARPNRRSSARTPPSSLRPTSHGASSSAGRRAGVSATGVATAAVPPRGGAPSRGLRRRRGGPEDLVDVGQRLNLRAISVPLRPVGTPIVHVRGQPRRECPHTSGRGTSVISRNSNVVSPDTAKAKATASRLRSKAFRSWEPAAPGRCSSSARKGVSPPPRRAVRWRVVALRWRCQTCGAAGRRGAYLLLGGGRPPGGGRRVCHGAPATSAPVDHASRASWGRTARPPVPVCPTPGPARARASGPPGSALDRALRPRGGSGIVQVQRDLDVQPAAYLRDRFCPRR